MSKDIEDLNPQDIHDDYIIKNDVNLNPIKKTDIERYRALIEKLGIRK